MDDQHGAPDRHAGRECSICAAADASAAAGARHYPPVVADPDVIARRVARGVGVPDLVDALAALPPTDLQSLLIAVHRRAAARVRPADVLARFESDAFARPADGDPRTLAEVERIALDALPDGCEPLALAPVCPLGTVSAITPLDQRRVLATDRRLEVLADPTNVLALEAARRRRPVAARAATLRLAALARVLRTQRFDDPAFAQHFSVVGLVTAGRARPADAFEEDALVEHASFHLRLVAACAVGAEAFVRISALGGESPAAERACERLAAAHPDAAIALDPGRRRGRGYYARLALQVALRWPGCDEIEIADGGAVDWTRRLLSDAKERLLISGAGTERLAAARGEAR